MYSKIEVFYNQSDYNHPHPPLLRLQNGGVVLIRLLYNNPLKNYCMAELMYWYDYLHTYTSCQTGPHDPRVCAGAPCTPGFVRRGT